MGFAFFKKSLGTLIFENKPTYGGNNPALESLIQSQTDGITGTIFLFVGFILQFLGSVGMHDELVGQILAAIFLVAGTGYFALVRQRIVSRRFEKANELRATHRQQSKT